MATRKQLGPSYDEEAYWEEKFQSTGAGFEWLGPGEVLLDAYRNITPRFPGSPPRVLHLGAGTSRLSLDLATDVSCCYASLVHLDSIVNADFSQTALSIGEQRAAEEGLQGMQYARVDLRSWKELSSCALIAERAFDVILDKSTSDAISTNADVLLDTASPCPLLGESGAPLDPLDLVALHLAALSGPGCVWVVLSYSASRFEILDRPDCHSGRFWTLLQQTSIQAPSGSDNPSAPPVYHWLYHLERK